MTTREQLPNRVSAQHCFSSSAMDSETLSVLMSNDVHTTESDVEKGDHTINGHISQIPGLSPAICSLPEERARGRRVGVRESDSDYVKLAKQGGHKGLLWHEESFNSQPNSYRPPDWFCTAPGDASKPSSLINSEEKKSPGAFQPPAPPFATDNMSAWERDDSSSNEKEKNSIHVDCSQMGKLQTSNQYHQGSKFKRIVFDKKPAPVDMSKLLSFGYAEDNKPVQ